MQQKTGKRSIQETSMARPEGSRNTLIAITYDTIGELADGIAGDTARQYAQRGQFDPRNLDSLLAWVNARRTTKGLPMIGVPDGDNQVDAPTTTSTPALPEMSTILACDPRTGCFRQDF
jgi:hypothetical protein